MALLPCLAVTLLIAAVLPAAAMGTTVTRDDDNGIITIEGDAGVDDVTISVVGGEHVIEDPSGVSSGQCTVVST